MPRSKRGRRRTPKPAITPWIVLAGSLAIVGFACTHHPDRPQHTAAVSPRPHVATPVASRPTPVPPQPAATMSPAPRPAPSAVAAASPSSTPSSAVPIASPKAPASPGTARLAIIIDDCGQWPVTERGFIALAVPLTLSVLPEVRYNHVIEREAQAADKGVMLHLPMETVSGLDPGPGKVTTEMGDGAIATQVERDLADVDLARGVNNHEGSRATADPRVMNDVMAVLARRDRFFIDSRTNASSVALAIATHHGVATAGRDVFLDNHADVAYTEGQLRAAAALAKRDGSAIAIGHPRPTTLSAVRALIPELRAQGITFVLAGELTR